VQSQRQIIGLIVEAFEDWPPPTTVLSDPNGPFADSTVSNFAGKLWQQVITQNLSTHADALVYFTPEAHRYYLPAFMVLSLSSPEHDDHCDLIVHHFSRYEDPFWAKRIGYFSARELESIECYIRAIADRENLDFERDGVSEALEGLERAKANKALNADAGEAGAG